MDIAEQLRRCVSRDDVVPGAWARIAQLNNSGSCSELLGQESLTYL